MSVYKILSTIWRNTFLKWKRQEQLDKTYKQYCVSDLKGKQNTTYYIIRREEPFCGLAAYILHILADIDFAVKKGYVPVVDMENIRDCIYKDSSYTDTNNVWDYYFKQPGNVKLSDITDNDNKIIQTIKSKGTFGRIPTKDAEFLSGKGENIAYWRKLAQKYIVVNDSIKEKIEREYGALFNGRVIGVIARGTDYTNLQPKGHAIQPTIEQILVKLEEMMNKYQFDKIFIATEDPKIFNAVKENYGDIVFTNRTDFITYEKGMLGENIKNSKCSPYDEGLCYLSTMLLLTKCQCLCASICGAAAVVQMLVNNDTFEESYIFDLGEYDGNDLTDFM